MYQNKQHIFFDLDHTLWDFDKNSALTFQKLFERHDIPLSLKVFLEVYEPINLNYWKLYREEKIEKEVLRFSMLDDTFKALNLSISSHLIHILSDEYITYLSTFNNLFEGTLEILEYLKYKYKLHIITNGFKEVHSD